MNQIDLQNLAEELETLKESELIYVLSKVLPKYDPFIGDPVIEGSRFVLGVAYKEKSKHKLSIVSYPDPDEYGDDLGPDWGFCQSSGSSEWDNIEYISNVKHGISPYTGEKVYMT